MLRWTTYLSLELISKMHIFNSQPQRITTSFADLRLAIKMWARNRWSFVSYMVVSLPVLTIGDMSVLQCMKWALHLENLILTYGCNLERNLMSLIIGNVYYCIHMKFLLSWKNLRSFSEKKFARASPWGWSQLVPLFSILATKYPRSQWQMGKNARDLDLYNISRLMLQMWKTTSKKEGRNCLRKNRLRLSQVLIALKLMCPLNSNPMGLHIFNRWLVLYGGLSNLIVLNSQCKLWLRHQWWPFSVKVISKSCFKCLPFWRTSIMLLWSLTRWTWYWWVIIQEWVLASNRLWRTERCNPPNSQHSLGIRFTMQVFVGSVHAVDSITRRSRTGFLIILNCSSIYWLSKNYTSNGTSSFGSECVAMK